MLKHIKLGFLVPSTFIALGGLTETIAASTNLCHDAGGSWIDGRHGSPRKILL